MYVYKNLQLAPNNLANFDCIITMLPNAEIVNDFLFGKKHDFRQLLRPNSLLIDCSTIGPKDSMKIYQTAKTAHLRFVDAPVSGGVKGAENASLTFMVGSENGSVFDVK